MYQELSNLILAFHGCHKDIFNRVIIHGESLKKSSNEYDWLGNGVYFWEQNFERAKEWAERRYQEDAAVIGAVIDLGYCLNLTDSACSKELKSGYETLKFLCETAKTDLPKNRPSSKTKDILLRDLDCAVIQQIHDNRNKIGQRPYDSVRGVFVEGDKVYPGSEFYEKTHVQIAICNLDCIKGYFRPLEID